MARELKVHTLGMRNEFVALLQSALSRDVKSTSSFKAITWDSESLVVCHRSVVRPTKWRNCNNFQGAQRRI
jgi:hypothetical protein